MLMFGWVLNEIWIIDLSSVLFGMLMCSSRLLLFSNEAHSRLLLELFCVIVIKHVAFFTDYVCEINNGIHLYQFTFGLLHFCFRM